MSPTSPKRAGWLERRRAQIIEALVSRFRPAWLLRTSPERPTSALFVFINAFISIAIMTLAAEISHTPFIFPPLGPTAMLLFYRPLIPPASPRNTICGYAIGIACGYGALLLAGLRHAPPVMAAGASGGRVFAAALSLALTVALMVLLKTPHPPAAAAPLIISLGIITKPFYLLVLEMAVVLLVLQAIVINRLAGLDYPLWAKREETR